MRIYAELELTNQDKSSPKSAGRRVTVGDRPEENSEERVKLGVQYSVTSGVYVCRKKGALSSAPL